MCLESLVCPVLFCRLPYVRFLKPAVPSGDDEHLAALRSSADFTLKALGDLVVTALCVRFLVTVTALPHTSGGVVIWSQACVEMVP